jgi:TPR repeat protein
MAADQGDELAENSLGLMYKNGQGVPKDSVQAYMWFTLAVEHGNVDAVRNRESIAYLLTAKEIADAVHKTSQLQVKK